MEEHDSDVLQLCCDTTKFSLLNFRSIWFEAATVVAVPPPMEIPAGSVLKAALVGGLSCALSTSLLHPIDTIKVKSSDFRNRFINYIFYGLLLCYFVFSIFVGRSH